MAEGDDVVVALAEFRGAMKQEHEARQKVLSAAGATLEAFETLQREYLCLIRLLVESAEAADEQGDTEVADWLSSLAEGSLKRMAGCLRPVSGKAN
jgi:hypothetical protein